jgi:hypothetical protein
VGSSDPTAPTLNPSLYIIRKEEEKVPIQRDTRNIPRQHLTNSKAMFGLVEYNRMKRSEIEWSGIEWSGIVLDWAQSWPNIEHGPISQCVEDGPIRPSPFSWPQSKHLPRALFPVEDTWQSEPVHSPESWNGSHDDRHKDRLSPPPCGNPGSHS